MKLLPVFALTLVIAPAFGAPALADTVRSCAELTDPDSPNFNADRDTWWRYTDERGISCAQGDAGMSDDSAAPGDEGDSSDAPPPPADKRPKGNSSTGD